MGHPQFPLISSQGQPSGSLTGSRRWHPGCRRCLLKGCERWFLPKRPQARFCSPACQTRRAAMAALACRSDATGPPPTANNAAATRRDAIAAAGNSARLAPSHRHILLKSSPSHRWSRPEPPPTTDPPTTLSPAGEGQRPDRIPEKSCGLPCDRPGCYVLFLPTPRSPLQHFCSCSCRQALRRVRQREARLRQRRQCGGRPQRRCHRGPPTAAPFMSSRIENPPP